MHSFHKAVALCWSEVLAMNETHKLVIVHADRIEGTGEWWTLQDRDEMLWLRPERQ